MKPFITESYQALLKPGAVFTILIPSWNNLPFLKLPFPTIKHLVHDRWLAINLAENNTLASIEDNLITYRIHSNQAIGGKTKNIEIYIYRDLKTVEEYMVELDEIRGKRKYLKYKNKYLQLKLKLNQLKI